MVARRASERERLTRPGCPSRVLLMSSRVLRCLGVLLAGLFASSSLAQAPGAPASDVFEAYLHPPAPPADAFDPPPASTRAPAGSEVRALAHGRVETADAEGRSLTLEHFYYENHELLR